MRRAGEEGRQEQLGLSKDRFDFLDEAAEDELAKGGDGAYLAGPSSPLAARTVLSPVHPNKGRSHWKERGEVKPHKTAENATSKGAFGKRSGQTLGRKFDARRESVSLTRYFQQMANGPGITDLADDGEDLLAAIKEVDPPAPAVSKTHLAPVAEDTCGEEPPEAEYGPCEAPQADAAESPQRFEPASPPQAEPKAASDEEGHDLAGVMEDVTEDGSSGAEVGGEEVPKDLLAPEQPAHLGAEEPEAAPMLGEDALSMDVGEDVGLPAHQDPAAATATGVVPEPLALPVSAASVENGEIVESPLSPETEAMREAAEFLVAETMVTPLGGHVGVSEAVEEHKIPDNAAVCSSATAQELGKDTGGDKVSEQADQTHLPPADSAADKAAIPAEQDTGTAAAAILEPALHTEPPADQARSPVSSGVGEGGSLDISDQRDLSGSEAESIEEEDSSEEEEEESTESSESSEGDSSSSDESPARPQSQAVRFPTRLLDDYAAIITPVRNLTQQSKAAAAVARPLHQSPEDVSPQEVSKCLEPSVAELEDSPNQASPVPLKPQRRCADQDDLPLGGTEAKRQLASVVLVSSPQELLGRSDDPGCPVRPFSASENIRWEMWGEEGRLAPGEPRTAEDAARPLWLAGDGSASPSQETANAEQAQSPPKVEDRHTGSGEEAGEAEDVFDASGDEEPIFAYISMASGIITPAKAAQTPATTAKPSTAKKTRFQPASVPRQPFASLLEVATEAEEDTLAEPIAPVPVSWGTADHGQPSPEVVESSAVGQNRVEEQAGADLDAGKVAAEDHGEPVIATSWIDGMDKMDEVWQRTEAGSGGPGHQGIEEGGTECGGTPATPFAGAAVEAESGESTPLECLERLTSDLLIDAPAEGPTAPASVLRTSRGMDRTLSRFAPDASLSRHASTSSVGQSSPGAATALPDPTADLLSTSSPAGVRNEVEGGLQGESAVEDMESHREEVGAPSSPAALQAESVLEAVVDSDAPDTTQQEPEEAATGIEEPVLELQTASEVAEPEREATGTMLKADSSPEASDKEEAQAVLKTDSSPGAGVKDEVAPPIRANFDADLASELASLSVPCQGQQGSSPPQATETPSEDKTGPGEPPSQTAQQAPSRLRRPESTKLAPLITQPGLPAASREKPQEASHIPKPSSKARPPRASVSGPSALPRLAKQPRPSRIPARSTEESRKAGRPPAGAPPNRAAAQGNTAHTSQSVARPAVKPTAIARPRSLIGRPSSREEGSPPVKGLQRRPAAAANVQTPPPNKDRRTPEYERMLNAALADEMMAFKGKGNRVANSPAEAARKQQQPSRLTASERHLRDWDGEPLV